MEEKNNNDPVCDQCGVCCRAPVILITKPSDYQRWVDQGRDDILKYATKPPSKGYGDFWMEMRGTEELNYCPFIRRNDEGKFECSIQDTKPEVCKAFYCAWCYGEGKKGTPFKTDLGWTDMAKNLGYGPPRNKKTE